MPTWHVGYRALRYAAAADLRAAFRRGFRTLTSRVMPPTLKLWDWARISLEVSRAEMAGAKRTRASRDLLEYV